MNNEANNEKVTPVETNMQRNNMVMPLVALGLVSVPFIFVLLSSLGIHIPMSSLLAIISPIAGCIVGISALQKKEKISRAGKIIAWIAVVLPLAFVALVFILFFGVVTGLIPLM